MPVQIPNHSHCVICTRATDFGEKTCSLECAEKLAALNKKRRRQYLLLMGLMVGLGVISILAANGKLGG